MSIDWKNEVEKQKDAYLDTTCEFLKIPSIYDESTIAEGMPFGKPISDALEYILKFCEECGFTVKNVDGYAGHAEFGTGDEIIGVLSHVDVVPSGSDWTTDAFSPEVRDGKLYARGSNDDKGPAMASVYALKIIKELGLPLNKRIRLIFGTDEENGDWIGMRKYFEKEPMPIMGFTPDAYFPIVTTEKGILSCDLIQPSSNLSNMAENGWTLTSFHAGDRVNMVAEKAYVVLTGTEDSASVKDKFESFLQEYSLEGSIEEANGSLLLNLEGISHHGMEPDKGLNAGLAMARFLNTLKLDDRAKQFVSLIGEYFVDSFFGEKLGIEIEDEISGVLTVNAGTFAYESTGKSDLGLSVRYPVATDFEYVMAKLEEAVAAFDYEVSSDFVNRPPHHIDKNHKLIKTLQKVYEEQTGEEAELLAIGGGTYGRAMATGVAFGPFFPGEIDTAHQKDEFIELKNMHRAMAIYAQAMYELAKDE